MTIYVAKRTCQAKNTIAYSIQIDIQIIFHSILYLQDNNKRQMYRFLLSFIFIVRYTQVTIHTLFQRYIDLRVYLLGYITSINEAFSVQRFNKITECTPEHQWYPYICDGFFSEKNDFNTKTCPNPTTNIATVTKADHTIMRSLRSSARFRPYKN